MIIIAEQCRTKGKHLQTTVIYTHVAKKNVLGVKSLFNKKDFVNK